MVIFARLFTHKNIFRKRLLTNEQELIMKHFKLILPDLIAVIFFAIISFAYFMPATIDGRVLTGSDHSGGIGAGREHIEYYNRTGKATRWTNTLFSGMPTYQIAPGYSSTSKVSSATKLYSLYLPDYVKYIFIFLLGFYILLRAFNFKPWMAALGAIIWAFSSYFFIIITAGHIWKVYTLAYIPPTIAGMVLTYKKKYILGGIVTALFTAFQIQGNHPQMSYYFLFVMLFMVIAYLAKAIKEKTIPAFLKSTAVVAVGGILGVCINISNLYHTYEYSKETMRGKSELVKKQTPESLHNQTSGLDRDYITQWSYGVGETWSLLIPNTKGGASSTPLAANKDAQKLANNNYIPLYQQIGQYWGEQPGTSGPVYVGAFVLMLFFLGCIIVKGPMKWALIAGTIFSIVLSWGKNFMGPTDFFIDYVPMYSKFRAVSSILVVAEFTIPLLAMFALKRVVEIISEGADQKQMKSLVRSVAVSFGLTGGIALLFALMPTLFFDSFVSSNEQSMLQNAASAGYIPADQLGAIFSNMSEMRQAIFTADCWRSFWVVLLGAIALVLFMMRKINSKLMVSAIIVICLVDMWGINKRYLNDGMFVMPSERKDNIKPTEADLEIMKDKSLDYRVLNLTTNTFNENETSTFHNSIGGYHAAKLRRYQELIDEHIQSEMQKVSQVIPQVGGDLSQVNGDSLTPVLNMLNTKYYIVGLQGGQKLPVVNPHANGNAWFVSNVEYVKNANEEIDALHHINTKTTAVVDETFKSIVGEANPDSSATIVLKKYEPNELTYETNAGKDGVAVFSEIYYPGWTATIDGKETEIARANYVLRSIRVPAGKHTVILSFNPKSLDITEAIAFGTMFILIIGIIADIIIEVRKRK